MGSNDEAASVETVQSGIWIEKSIEKRDGLYPRCIRLTFENRNETDKVAGVVEEFPVTCDITATKATDREFVTWGAQEETNEFQIRIELAAGEQRTIRYWPGDSPSTAFNELAQRTPRFEYVKSSPATDNRPDSEPRTQSTPHSDPDTVVAPDSEYIDPPPDRDFSAVAGLHDVKQELREEIIRPFTDPQFDEYDIGKANGLLLFGPPGTGKTHVATALAGELGYNFFEVDVGLLRDSEFGQTQENIAEVFELAEENQPCVVFFDELDSIAPERGSGLHQGRAEAVNQLLRHVGDVNERDTNVVVIGATNRPDQIDAALKRTGRFDTRIKIGMPDAMTRLAILETELRSFDGDVEPVWTNVTFIDAFVEATTNLSSSDVVEVVQKAERASVRRSARDEVPCVSTELIMEQVGGVTNKQSADTAGEFLTETPEIDFSAVGGMDETKQRLQETLLDPLTNPELYDEYGLEISNGVLLYGPPGTGKTYISRALAGEAGCSFLPITASDIVSKWVGEAAQNIQDLFEKAKDVSPAIVFIDEIDAIASSRGGIQMSNTEEQAVNELLAQISNLDNADVFVIGTTNRPDIIDDALTRSGRLGERVEIPPPDGTARVKILKTQLADRPVDTSEIDWDEIQQLTETPLGGTPYVAADMAKVVDEAARYAMSEAQPENLKLISQHHLEQAIHTVDPSLASAHETDDSTDVGIGYY